MCVMGVTVCVYNSQYNNTPRGSVMYVSLLLYYNCVCVCVCEFIVLIPCYSRYVS